MFGGTKRLPKAGCAVLSNGNQAIGETPVLLPVQPLESLAHGLGYGRRQALTRQRGQLVHQVFRLTVLYIHSHRCIPFYMRGGLVYQTNAGTCIFSTKSWPPKCLQVARLGLRSRAILQ